MLRASETFFVDGPGGTLHVIADEPDEISGLAVVAHPHPLFGGTNSNKVVYTLAHALRDLGYVALRPNFRGVGKSTGTHDGGRGETDDLLSVLDHAIKRWDAKARLPIVLAGFSFGAFVQTHVAKALTDAGRRPQRLVLVGTAVGPVEQARLYEPQPIPRDSILIHGDQDAVVPLVSILKYAEPIGVPVLVVAGADHFFHGRLVQIREIVDRAWRGIV